MVKGFKQTEVGLIPDDWDVKSVGYCADVVGGGTPSTFNLKFWNGKINWFTPTEVGMNKYLLESKRKITEEGYLSCSAKMLPVGSILLTSRAGIGDIGILLKEACTNQGFQSLIPKEHIAGEFLYYLVSTLKPVLLKNASGSTFLEISPGKIKAIEIPLPPTKTEQTAIATALNDADALITALEKLIAKKKAIKQGAMQELLRPKEGWESELLPELVFFQEGPGVRKHQFRNLGVKLLNGTNIEFGKLNLDKTDKFVSEQEAYGPYSHFLVDSGDILIACSGITVEKFDEKVTEAESKHLPLCMNTSTMRFKIISKRLDKYYFKHFLKSNLFKKQISEQITGSAQLNFGPAHVKWVEIKFPIIEEQQLIAEVLTDMDSEIEELEQKLEKQIQIKQGMMQVLLTGKIRLK